MGGPDGWGSYELKNVQRLVNKNSTTAYVNVSNYINIISKGLKAYGLLSNLIEAYNGNDEAKLKSIYDASELTIAWLSKNLTLYRSCYALCRYCQLCI